MIHEVSRHSRYIRIDANDNVHVAKVRVTISDEEGNSLEQGDAARVTPAVVTSGIWIDRIGESKVVESWVDWDRVGFFQQLGVIPRPGQAP